MSDEAQRWKEKYLKSIEQQEKLERRWDARLDLLRRGLVRSTLAAEGTDRVVDQCMKEMRDVVRTDDMDAGLAALLPRLEKAVLDSEQRRETRIEQVSTALTALVTQLQSLPLPREVAQPLKKFAKQLDGRVSQAREMPLLLSELSGLQGKALSQLATPTEPGRPGLLQRLFGSRDSEETPAQVAQAPAVTPSVQPEQPPVTHEAVPAPQAPVTSAEQVATAPVSPALIAAPVAEPSKAPEPIPEDFTEPEVVAFEPARILTEAPSAPSEPEPVEPESKLQPFTPPPVFAPAVPTAINPDELILPGDTPPPVILDSLPLPEPIAQALAAIDPEQSEHDILYALPDSPEPSYSSVARHIEDTLIGLLDDLTLPERHRPQAEAMRDRLKNGLNWYELLPILDDLATLMLAITDSGQHQKQRDAREQEVAGRLKSLAERVAHMEQEALGYREHLEEQRQKALIDPLTGLPNRAAWTERLEHEIAQWQQHGNTLSLAMLDLDHFKRINDNYGHLAGDKVLKIIATVLRKRMRGNDFIARFGGEEFVLLLPATPPAVGAKLLENLRASIEACPFHFKGERVTITISMGLAAFRPGEHSDLVLKRADQALYRAKNAGRNRVELG